MDFIIEIKDKINGFLNMRHENIILMWDNLKEDFKKIAIRYSKIIKELRDMEEKEIKLQLNRNITEESKKELEEKLKKITLEKEMENQMRAGKFSNLYITAKGLNKREDLKKVENYRRDLGQRWRNFKR